MKAVPFKIIILGGLIRKGKAVHRNRCRNGLLDGTSDRPGGLGEFRVSSWDFLGAQGYGKPETRRLPYGDYAPIAIAPTSTTSG